VGESTLTCWGITVYQTLENNIVTVDQVLAKKSNSCGKTRLSDFSNRTLSHRLLITFGDNGTGEFIYRVRHEPTFALLCADHTYLPVDGREPRRECVCSSYHVLRQGLQFCRFQLYLFQSTLPLPQLIQTLLCFFVDERGNIQQMGIYRAVTGNLLPGLVELGAFQAVPSNESTFAPARQEAADWLTQQQQAKTGKQWTTTNLSSGNGNGSSKSSGSGKSGHSSGATMLLSGSLAWLGSLSSIACALVVMVTPLTLG
jgi:hypothetical protein